MTSLPLSGSLPATRRVSQRHEQSSRGRTALDQLRRRLIPESVVYQPELPFDEPRDVESDLKMTEPLTDDQFNAKALAIADYLLGALSKQTTQRSHRTYKPVVGSGRGSKSSIERRDRSARTLHAVYMEQAKDMLEHRNDRLSDEARAKLVLALALE